MDFRYSDKAEVLRQRLFAFMDQHIYPNEARYEREIAAGDRWQPSALMEELKATARKAGLWNLFLPDSARGPRGGRADRRTAGEAAPARG